MATSYGYDRQRPRTQVVLDASSLGSANVASEKPLVLIGSANGGEPHVVHELTNFSQAREIFRGGELLDAIEFAWNPGEDVPKAGRIFAIRSDEATPGTLEKDGLKVTSKLYGVDANNIQVELSDNSLTKSKRFSVYFTKERYEKVYDNIGNIFSVKYTGEEAQAQVEVKVDETTKLATKLILSVGASAETLQAVRTYDLGQGVYEDVNVLVHDINNLPDFEASMDAIGGNKNVETQFLDALEAVSVKDAAVVVKAVGADLINRVVNDPYVSVTVDRTKALPENFVLTNLSGAATNASPASWSELFDLIPNIGSYYITPLTADEAIHGELSQFLRDESTNGNQLRAFVGGGFGESIEELRTRQMALRNSRVSLVGDSITRRMADGRVYNAPSYMYAALVAGVASGLPIGEPVTYKRINIASLDRRFTGDQIDQLDASGIIMTEFVRTRSGSYFRIVNDPTTYNVTTEPVQNQISLGEVSDFLTTELRTVLDEEFIGTRIRQTSASIIKNRVESFLDRQKDVDGLIVDYNPDDIQVIISGNTARIYITVQPSEGLDYINVFLTYEDKELKA